MKYQHPVLSPGVLGPFVTSLDIKTVSDLLHVSVSTVYEWLNGATPNIEHQRDLSLLHASRAPVKEALAMQAILRSEMERSEKEYIDILCDDVSDTEAALYRQQARHAAAFYRIYRNRLDPRLD